MAPIKHGNAKRGARTPLYSTWWGMMQRCNYPRHAQHKDYGGRGIAVCDSWHTFANFANDMPVKPEPSLTLDRIDNNRGYEPGNVRWATRKEQTLSRRRLSTSLSDAQVQEVHGRIEHGESQISVARRFQVSHTTISKIRLGKTHVGSLKGHSL